MKTFSLLLGGLLALIGPGLAVAQGPPSTDIVLVAMHNDQVVLPHDQLINLTDRDGYDNQPFFTPDGKAVLYTSAREGQTEIYRVELATRRPERVTNTPESEYSPTIMPNGDGISTVRVEADGTQRLWRFDLNGKDPTLVLDGIKPVGYHAWADGHTLALFVLGDPPTLQQADTRTGKADTLVYGIGRSIHRVPGAPAISFVHKETDDAWIIKTLDPATGRITPVVATLPGREDYAWRPDGSLLMADGAVLHAWAPTSDIWQPLYDFAPHGITTITRIAVSPDGSHVALVVDR